MPGGFWFTPMSAKDAGRGLTAGAFASLLARIGPDGEHAGAAYEHLRRALVSFFAWRGAATPEECADETLDRLAARVDEGVVVEDLPRFARGIAKLVLLEHWRRPEARGVPLEGVDSRRLVAPEAPEEGPLLECCNRCLSQLASDGRDLILEYYAGEGRGRIDARKRLARTLGISEAALRSRAQRVRDQLERCIARCRASPSVGEPPAGFDDTNS
jgi:DNA-directed RNA polymerase specialized sigma24 family protein